MMDIFSSSFFDFHATGNLASAVCNLNGKVIPCGDWAGVLAPFLLGAIITALAVVLAVGVLTVVGTWKVYKKAGQKGWAALIPIYNIIVMLRVIKEPWWWIFFYFVPVANFVISLIVAHELSRVFGKGWGTALGLVFLPFVFYPILGFGDAVYNPSVKEGTPAPQI